GARWAAPARRRVPRGRRRLRARVVGGGDGAVGRRRRRDRRRRPARSRHSLAADSAQYVADWSFTAPFTHEYEGLNKPIDDLSAAAVTRRRRRGASRGAPRQPARAARPAFAAALHFAAQPRLGRGPPPRGVGGCPPRAGFFSGPGNPCTPASP